MEIVNDLSAEHLAYWVDADGIAAAQGITMKAPEGMDDCADCAAVLTETADGQQVVRVAWRPSEIDLAHLAHGGTVWLSCFGGLPPHMIEVQAP